MCADSPAAPTELPHPSLVKSYALLYHKKSAAGLSELVAAAEAGQAKAQAVLALLYLRPKFLGASYQALFISQPKMPPKDLDKAIDFARRAADQNDADGHLVLALICREKGDTQNFLLHAREAANAQTDIAQFLLGIALMSKKPPRREIARMV
jgi:TPR repeat protein